MKPEEYELLMKDKSKKWYKLEFVDDWIIIYRWVNHAVWNSWENFDKCQSRKNAMKIIRRDAGGGIDSIGKV